MDRIDTIEVPRTLPRPAAVALARVGPHQVDKASRRRRRRDGAGCDLLPRPRTDVPVGVLRDRVLFETAYVRGARASEVCGMYVEDLDLRLDHEHARLHGKSGTVRTVLLDDRGYLALLRLYLARSGYTSGPLFRASINGRGGPLSYDAAHSRCKKYGAAAGTGIGIHQPRHAHAGVSIEVVRRRLDVDDPWRSRSRPNSAHWPCRQEKGPRVARRSVRDAPHDGYPRSSSPRGRTRRRPRLGPS
jgi:integrase/recombinase XerD